LLTFLDLPFDNALAYSHPHAVHGSRLRERKDVNAFQPKIQRVVELLSHPSACNQTRYSELYISVERRRGEKDTGMIGSEEKATCGGLMERYGRF
jgi:hypothetical protein